MNSIGTSIVHRGIIFQYDMGDPKSFIGAPTTNYMNTYYPKAQSSYTTYVANTSGEWQNNHPDAITVYSHQTGGSINGFVNSGVGGWANTDHAHWMYDTEVDQPVVVQRNYDGGVWKAFYGNHSLNLAAMGYSTGDYYVYSYDLWTTHLSYRPNPGMYSKNSSSTNGFWDGQGGSATDNLPLVLGEWHRRWCAFQINANHDVTKAQTLFYWYGYQYQTNQMLKIRRPQLELGTNVASPWTLNPRTSTDSLLDTKGNIITIQSLTYANNNIFEFRSAGADYLQIADTLGEGGTSYPASWADDLFTLEVWHYYATGDVWNDSTTFGSNNGTPIVGRGGYAGAHGLWRSSTADQILFGLRTDVSLYSAAASGLAKDTWHHIVGTWDGVNNKIYVNGAYVSQSTPTWTSATSIDTGVWHVGGNLAYGGNNGGYLDGKIPIVRIYNRPLDAGEVSRNYEAQRARFGV